MKKEKVVLGFIGILELLIVAGMFVLLRTLRFKGFLFL
jgi:hypothetical protein